MKTFIKRFLGFSLGPVASAVISFITVPLITQFVNPTEYGKASMFTTLQVLFASFIYIGMDQSYTREYQEEEDKQKLFFNSIILPFGVSLVILLILALFPQWFSTILFESPDYTGTVLLFGLLLLATVVERFILLSIRMREKALEYSLFSIILKLAVLVFALLYIFAGRRDFLTVVYSTVLGQLAGDLFLIVKYRSLFAWKHLKIDKPLIRKMFVFGLPIMVAASLSSVLNSLDRLFLRSFNDFHEVGIYTATMKIANVIGIVKTAFTSFWVPTAYRWYGEKKSIQHFKYISDVLLFLMTMLFFALVLLKRPITVILSEDYAESQYLIASLCLPLILYTLSETTTLGIAFSRRSFLNIFVSVFAIIPNIVLNLILTPRLGSIGAGIASASAYVAFFAARTLLSSRSGFRFRVWKHYAVIAILFACAVLNSFDVPNLLLWNVLLLATAIVAQRSTLADTVKIRNHPGEWDFS